MIGFGLMVLAWLLFLPLTIWNYWYVENKSGYFFSSALNLDIYANREFRTLWNKRLITADSKHKFGKVGESISSVLGKNERDGTLTKEGKKLVSLLNRIDKNHSFKSIQDNI